MADASIPVNLFNPGQVFASLGFLEVADVLLGEAEGGFDWSNEESTRFCLRANGHENPFAAVLQFLAESEIRCYGPLGFVSTPAKSGSRKQDGENADGSPAADSLALSESFPDSAGDRMALPVRLQSGVRIFEIGHWADGSSRHRFKLYAGNRSGYSIVSDMIRGKRDKPRKKDADGELKTKGLSSLWAECSSDLVAKPFDVLTAMGGSFNFDPRGGWTAIDAGYSPNEHSDHAISSSPVVEILAACGLEHTRPVEFEKRKVCYGAWNGCAPPILARAAFSGADVSLVVRKFRFALNLSGKNKVVTFAEEEKSA